MGYDPSNPDGAADYFEGPEPPTKQGRAYDRAEDDEKLHFAFSWILLLYDNPELQIPGSLVFGWPIRPIASGGRRLMRQLLEEGTSEYMANRRATGAMWQWNVHSWARAVGHQAA